jgi:hypothetical protein
MAHSQDPGSYPWAEPGDIPFDDEEEGGFPWERGDEEDDFVPLEPEPAVAA